MLSNETEVKWSKHTLKDCLQKPRLHAFTGTLLKEYGEKLQEKQSNTTSTSQNNVTAFTGEKVEVGTKTLAKDKGSPFLLMKASAQ